VTPPLRKQLTRNMVALEAFSMMYTVDIGRIGLSNGPFVYQLSVSSIINKTPQL